jgi:hypothetical protein
MSRSITEKWKWALWSAVAVTLLALCPQLLMWSARGKEWHGSYAELHGDEWVYSAYVQALIDGRPRRNDPYTGRDDRPNHPQAESLFSIQFVPAYLVALPARLIGVSSSTAFIVLGVLGPFFACLAIFWLIASLTQDHKVAAAGSLIVLCFGALAAGQGMVHVLSSGFQYSFLPFLRRYEPAAPFPLFFLFCTFVWKALGTDRRLPVRWAIAAGATLGLLIFSYFYLWTVAVAWLASLIILWVSAYPGNLRRDAKTFISVLIPTVAALVPYFVLLSRRSVRMDVGQKLTLSHAPDMLRVPELIGLAVIGMIVFGVVRRRIQWAAPKTLFATSFAITPFIVFNQQVITGHSLQPFHYESFIANYLVLVGLFVASVIIWRGPESAKRPMPPRFAARMAFVAIWWAAIEVMAPAKVIIKESQFTDRAAAVCQQLRTLSGPDETQASARSEMDPRPLVLATENKVAIILPTFAPQAVFWAPHFDFLDLAAGESRERFYKYLYYTGVDGNRFAKELAEPMSVFAAAAFGHERVIPDLSVQAKPITSEEMSNKVAEYQAYYSSFTRERAARHVLTYVITPAEGGPDLSNLDRWYQRDKGETVDGYTLYRVQLRS